MKYFYYKDKILYVEKLPIIKIAKEINTPFYCYSFNMLINNYKLFASSFNHIPTLVCYAVKANSNQAILTSLAKEGAGMDVVSIGELYRAIKAGVSGNKIVFSGVGKTEEEQSYALDYDILCFNIESEQELYQLAKIAKEKNKIANISFRINPDIDACTHQKISTGKSDNKFGIPWQQTEKMYNLASRLSNIKITGIDMHIGSQITKLMTFDKALFKMTELIAILRSQGHSINHVDIGGGLGISYQDPLNKNINYLSDYVKIVNKYIKKINARLLFEPGRFIVGNTGILITKVIYVKNNINKNFIIVDTAMNDLIRPTLYDAYHYIAPINQCNNNKTIYDIVGPICETGDYLAQSRKLPNIKQGELLSIFSTGAYGAVQSNTYNSRSLISEIMVNDNQFSIIRPRINYKNLVEMDNVPQWI